VWEQLDALHNPKWLKFLSKLLFCYIGTNVAYPQIFALWSQLFTRFRPFGGLQRMMLPVLAEEKERKQNTTAQNSYPAPANSQLLSTYILSIATIIRIYGRFHIHKVEESAAFVRYNLVH
jgi:hypothetical protein